MLASEKARRLREVGRAKLSLFVGFVWHDTPQGYDYWDQVHKNLLEVEAAIRAERCDPLEGLTDEEKQIAENFGYEN